MAHPRLRCRRAARRVVISTLCLLGIFPLFFFVAPTGTAFAGQVTVAWDPSTEAGVAGYKVYWGTVSRNYSWSADAGTQTTYTLPGLTEGATYYIAATAYDGSRVESGPSNEVAFIVPSACTYTISSNISSFPACGGTGTITVTTGSTCSWTASNTAPWVSISSGATGTGNGTVNYTVAANTGTTSRNAGLTIAGQAFSITQAGVQAVAQIYTINASAGSNGTIAPSGQVSVMSGANQTFTLTPASGYKVANVLVDGSSVGAVNSYTFSNVRASHTIQASFTQSVSSYTLTVTKAGTGSGTVTKNPPGSTFAHGTVVTLTPKAAGKSTFSGWSGACFGTSSTCTVIMSGNTAVTATFTSTRSYSSAY